mmetsp:Transcript_45748/g.147324  ORF Transcript_45748/g.147324 Transcript_45748/m.147324 type:complete len:328 (-) Transcript_45748:71-1054(-)
MLSHVVPDVVRHANLEGGPSPARLRVRVHGAVRRLDVPDRARVVADDRREAAEALRCALLRAGRPDPGAVREHRKDGRLVEGDQELGVCGEGVDHVRREGGEVVDERAVGPAAVCERPLRERVVEEGEHNLHPLGLGHPHDLAVPRQRHEVLHPRARAPLGRRAGARPDLGLLPGLAKRAARGRDRRARVREGARGRRREPRPVDAHPKDARVERGRQPNLRFGLAPKAQPLSRARGRAPGVAVRPAVGVELGGVAERQPRVVQVVLHVRRCSRDAKEERSVKAERARIRRGARRRRRGRGGKKVVPEREPAFWRRRGRPIERGRPH